MAPKKKSGVQRVRVAGHEADVDMTDMMKQDPEMFKTLREGNQRPLFPPRASKPKPIQPPKPPKVRQVSEKAKDLAYLEAQRQRANTARAKRGVPAIPKAKKYGGIRQD